MRRRNRRRPPSEASHTFFVEYEDKEYSVTGFATFSHDANYGADADGNRGMPMDFIDDVWFKLDDRDKDLPKETQQQILKLAGEKSDPGEWKCENEYDDDYDDCDD